MTKLLLIILTPLFLLTLYFFYSSNTNKESTEYTPVIQDNIQNIEINAKGGYYPKNITAKANTASILRIKTNNTFDCSLALVIDKLKVNQVLPQTGTTEFKIDPNQAVNTLTGRCSMGMYSFVINFK